MKTLQEKILDVVGIGFGPSNLALAIALQEQRPIPRSEFFEEKDDFAWHPAMMLDDTTVQNSFLKDLITLRDPTSEFSFLAYLKNHDRLHRFINLRNHNPARWEFNDYFRWAAKQFTDQVHYGWRVTRLRPNVEPDGTTRTLTVSARSTTGADRELLARNVVIGVGGQPNMLPKIVPESSRVIHSSHFLDSFPKAFPDRSAAITIGVVGAGQSGAEIAYFLLREYPAATVHWVLTGPAPRPADDNPFVNDIFMADEVDRHYGAHEEGDTGYHENLRNSNYGVADTDLLYALYRRQYEELARGAPRLDILTRSRLTAVAERAAGLELEINGQASARTVDSLVLASGYERRLPPEFADEILPLLQKDARGQPFVERGYRLAVRTEMEAGVFVQGLAEHTHGLGDTLFPVLPFRSAEIARQVVREKPRGTYPPAKFTEARVERLHATIRQYPLATLIAEDAGQLHASHIPMILHEDAGAKGRIFGHVDVNNPQATCLEGREVLAVFQGPNAYISPRIWAADQLPTWNFVTVHVRGTVRLIHDQNELVAGLASIPSRVDQRPAAYRLSPDDPRIPLFINGIVGFWLEIRSIEGYFKLSQDCTPEDRSQSREELARAATPDQTDFIDWLHDHSDS